MFNDFSVKMKFWNRFKKLLKNSVVTGIPQIVDKRNASRKCLRVVVLVCCVFGFFWQTLSFLGVYWTYPTVIDVQYYFPDSFDLPALSVCSHNSIKSEIFCSRFPNLCSSNSSLEEFCKKNRRLCDMNYMLEENDSSLQFPTITPRHLPPLPRSEYQEMGMKAEDLVTQCIIYDSPRVQDCLKDYQMVNVFDTMGLPSNCYAYNSLWGQTKVARSIKTKTLIILVLKSERTRRNQFYSSSPFVTQLSIHSPYSIVNPFSSGFSIKPCSNYYIFPWKQVSELLPPPYTTACYDYKALWMKRSGRTPLTKSLCTEECLLNKSVEYLGCADPFFITYPNMDKICTIEPQISEIYRQCRNGCPQACHREDISVDIQEHSKQTSKHAKAKGNECTSVITISFNKMGVLKYSHSPKYENVSLFSYVGGYLGLWLGISLVAICDIMETALLIIEWLILTIRKHRKNKLKSKAFKFKRNSGPIWMI